MTHTNRFTVLRIVVGVTLVALGGLAIADSGGLQAQTPAPQVTVARPELQQLKQRVEQRFTVLILRQSLVLVPKAASKEVTNIELTDGQVVIDGNPVIGKELRQRLGPDADLVAQLSFLDAAARRQLFEKVVPAAAPAPAAVPVPPAPAEVPSTDPGFSQRDHYRYGGARVRIGSDVWVRENEAVANDVVAILGSVHVDGRVDGEVVAVGGNVTLGPKADIRGDVTSVAGGVERDVNAHVGGQINEVKFTLPSIRPYVRIRPWQNWSWNASPFAPSVALVATLVRIGMIGLFAMLIVTVFPGKVQSVSAKVEAEPWRAALTGLAAQILFVPLLVLTVVILAVSIIGIPLLLLVPFVLVAMLAALVLGFSGVGCAIGQQFSRRTTGGLQGLVLPLVIGLGVIWALTLIARFVGLAGNPLRIVISGVLVVGFIVEYVAWTVGLGGVLLSRFGRPWTPPATYRVPPPPPLEREPQVAQEAHADPTAGPEPPVPGL